MKKFLEIDHLFAPKNRCKPDSLKSYKFPRESGQVEICFSTDGQYGCMSKAVILPKSQSVQWL